MPAVRKGASLPLVREVEDFYIRNPDEVLSLADMAVKFGATVNNCKDSVFKLRRQGFLRTIPNGRGRLYGRAQR